VLQSLDAAGALTPRELAEAERVQPPTITKIVARLEERGLVSVHRIPPTVARRSCRHRPRDGRLTAEYRRSRDEWLAQRLAKLSPEERETVQRAAEILTRIARD